MSFLDEIDKFEAKKGAGAGSFLDEIDAFEEPKSRSIKSPYLRMEAEKQEAETAELTRLREQYPDAPGYELTRMRQEQARTAPEYTGLASSEKPPEERGIFSEAGVRLERGAAVHLPKMIARSAQVLAPEGSSVQRWGEREQEFRENLEQHDVNLAPSVDPVKRPIKAGLMQGLEMVAPSMAIGTAAGLAGAPAAVGAGLTAGSFGLSAGHERYQRGIEAGETREQALRAGVGHGVVEGVGESVAGMLGPLKWVARGGRPARGAAANVIKNLATKTGIKEMAWKVAKDYGLTLASETSTELGQHLGQRAIDIQTGLDKTPITGDELAQVALATLSMTSFMAPLGAAGQVQQAKQYNRIRETLENPQSDPRARDTAAKAVSDILRGVDKQAADNFEWNYARSRAAGQPMKLDGAAIEKKTNVGETGFPLAEGAAPADDPNAIRPPTPGSREEFTALRDQVAEGFVQAAESENDPDKAEFMREAAELLSSAGNMEEYEAARELVKEEIKKRQYGQPEVAPAVGDGPERQLLGVLEARRQQLIAQEQQKQTAVDAVREGAGSAADEANKAALDAVVDGTDKISTPPPAPTPTPDKAATPLTTEGAAGAPTGKPAVGEIVQEKDGSEYEIVGYREDGSAKRRAVKTRRFTTDYGKTYQEGYRVGEEIRKTADGEYDLVGFDIVAIEGVKSVGSRLVVDLVLPKGGVVLRWVKPGVAPAAPAAPAEPQDTRLVDVPVRQVPDNQIAVKADLMQFKKVDESETGVNIEDRITSDKWDDLKAGTLLLWEPVNPAEYGLAPEQRYVVANGHHRLEYGRRMGRAGYNAQVIREADGVSAQEARAIAAETNIADGKGSIYDQVKYLRNTAAAYGQNEALARGRSIGNKGRKAASIAFKAADRPGQPGESDLIDAFINEVVTPDQAEAIAEAAPNDAGWQAVGLKRAASLSGDKLRATLLAAQQLANDKKIVTVDQGQRILFEEVDDAAWRQSELAGDAALEIQREIRDELTVLRAGRRLTTGERQKIADKWGIKVNDPTGMRKAEKMMVEELARWKNFGVHADLVAQVKRRLEGGDAAATAVAPSPGPSKPSEPAKAMVPAAKAAKKPAAAPAVVPKPAPTPAPMPTPTTVLQYSPALKITNLDQLPRGTGTRYLEVTRGENGVLVAKQWRRAPVEGAVLVDFGEKAKPKLPPPKSKRAASAPAPASAQPATAPAPAGAAMTVLEAIHAGQRVKPPAGATFVRVTDTAGRKAVVAVKDVDTLADAGPYKSVEWLARGKKDYVPVDGEGVVVAPKVEGEKLPAPKSEGAAPDDVKWTKALLRPVRDPNGGIAIEVIPVREKLPPPKSAVKPAESAKAPAKLAPQDLPGAGGQFNLIRDDARDKMAEAEKAKADRERAEAKAKMDKQTPDMFAKPASEMSDAEIAKGLSSDRNFIIPDKPRAEVKSPIANLSEADQARMKELQAKLRQKLGGQVNTGIDPEVLVMGAEMAGLYIKGGTKTFQQFATNMKTDMTDIWDRVKRYLHGIWMTAAADNPEIEEISRADAAKVVADLDKPAAKPKMPAPRSEQTAPKPVETPAESGMKIVEQYHSKRMKNVYIVTMAERVTKDEYNVLAARARRLGGKWSREWKPTNSPAGFMFNQREHADEFVRLSQPAKAQPAPQKAETSALQAEMRELIQSEDNMQRKAIQMRQNAEKRGMTLKEYQEAVEFEIVKMADEIASDRDMPIQLRDRELVQLYELQPVLSARTSTSMELQAYSTPAPLANIGRQMIGADKADRVYEPTAGNGMLLIGIDKSKVVANELDPDRADNLRKLGVKNVTTEDASRSWTAPDGVFDAMMMNPPFGPTDTTNIDGYAIKKLEHVIALRALSRLSSNGRAFIVLGANRDPVIGDGADRTFLNYIYNNFNVAGHFEVDGDLYAKQGAKWPVRVLVIDGRRQDVPAVPENLAPKSVDRFDRWDRIFMKAEEIQDEIEKRRNSLDSGRGSRDDVRPGEGAKPAGEPGVVPVAPGQDSGAANPGGRGARAGGDGTSGISTEKQPAIRGTDDVTPEVPAPARRPAPAYRGPDSETGGRGDAATGTPGRGEGNDTAADGSDAAGRSPEVRGRTLSGAIRSRANDLLGEIVNEGQRRYIPLSKSGSLETLVPANLAQGIAESLAILEDRIGGDVDAWVADKLGYKSKDELYKAMAAEQIDAVALAIDQIEQGGALIIGDETGIGKGREAAGIIRYCQTQGIVPVFFTHNAKLFTDIYRDIQDIGSDFKPLLLGGKQSEANIVDENGKTLFRAPSGAKKSSAMRSMIDKGAAESGYDSVVLTYSQINRQNERQEFLTSLADNERILLIMDEAHDASGEDSMQGVFVRGGVKAVGKGANRVNHIMPGLVNHRNVAGAVYLSATYAKKADNMPLYSKTMLGRAADSMETLVEAMKRGGVAMQQAVAEGLSKTGQLIRRERDFSGTSFEQKNVGLDKQDELRDTIDNVTSVLREVRAYSSRVRDKIAGGVIDGLRSTSMTDAQIAFTEFASIAHNYVSQMLLATKVDAVVQEAVEAHKRGEKPVIALMSTMEAVLDEFADQSKWAPGQHVDVNFKDLMKRALDRTMRATETDATGNTNTITFRPEDVGLEAEYQYVLDLINEMDVELPVSPIDAILTGLRKAGIRVVEYTGRTSGIAYDGPNFKSGTYERRAKVDKNRAINMFNSGEYDAMIINASGAVGLSIHASPIFKERPIKTRNMIIAQAHLDITIMIQLLGRIKRTGMIPGGAKYTMPTLPIEAERRPALMLERKMKSLNANTTAAAEGGVNLDQVDFINKYGAEVIARYLEEVNPDLRLDLDIYPDMNDDGTFNVDEKLAIEFTGKMALMPNAVQQEAYEAIIDAYKEHVEYLKATDQYDLEMRIYDDWDGVKISDEVLTHGENEESIFTSSVKLQKWDVKDTRHVPTAAEMKKTFESKSVGVDKFRNKLSEFDADVRDRFEKKRARIEKIMAESPESSPAHASAKRQESALQTMLETYKNVTSPVLGMVSRSAGEFVAITEDGDEKLGIITEISLPKQPTDGVVSRPSAIVLHVMVNRPGGSYRIPLNRITSNAVLMEGTSVSDKDIDAANSRGGRYERQVLVGNPIRAYEVTGFTGQMVSFNAKEGGTVTGILMPASWKPENMARDPRLDLVNERAVGAWVKEYGIAVSSGEAYISRRMYGRSGYEIVVPSSRSKGAILFLDNVLRDTTGDFVKKGSKMIAVVGNISDVVLAARRIREITQKPFRPTSKPPDGAVQAINEQAKSEGDTRFSVAEPSARGAAMSETDAFDTLTEISDAVDVGLVQTVATEADLPPAVKAEAQRMGYTGRVEAVAYDGKVWIVRDRMRSKDHMKAKVVHEMVHLGVREALTKPALDTVLNQTLTSFGRKMEMAAIARRRGLDLSKTGDYKVALEELIAKISEQRKAKPKVWQRFVAAIRQYLREKGYALALTDDDLDVLIGRALGRMAGGAESGVGAPAARFSVTPEQDREYMDAVERGDMDAAQKMVDARLSEVGAYWHGTPSGDLRGGATGLHVGTKQAATEALEARIGIPADGKGWNGDREYGKTLLAGKNRISSGQFGKYRESGYNTDIPDADFYPTSIKQPTVGKNTPVEFSWKPYVRPVMIVGNMTNNRFSPMADTRANATMGGMLRRGVARRGYFYTNDGEDAGSVSAVLPNGDAVRVKLADPVTRDDAGAVIPLSERFNPRSDDIRFSLSGESAQSDIGFYSQVERAIAGFKQMKATGDQWARWLEKQPGVKKEELDWLGVKEWLAERPSAVTKADVLDFVRANEVDVREVERSNRAQKAEDEKPMRDYSEKTPKFGQYQTPGGENYREVLLTLPNKSSLSFSKFSEGYLENNPEAQENELRRQYEMYSGGPSIKSVFISSHFDEPNILAHIRMNERTDADGKRVLFVEEVQSDWHQKGKKDGYKVQGADILSRVFTGVPDAPFKTSWPMLAMKRVIRMAAEEGFDRVAWTTGEQQAERYDLSKQIGSIGYSGTNLKAYDLKGKEVISRTGVQENDLPDIIGKEATQKLLAAPKKGTLRMIEGEDLKVGGEGMKGFYDLILPAEVNKYVKKWGARVGKSPIGAELDGWAIVDATGNPVNEDRYNSEADARIVMRQKGIGESAKLVDEKTHAVHALDITPAMRESVMAGQPMFALADDPSIEALQEHVNAGRLSPHTLQAAWNVLGRARQEGIDVDFEYQDIVKTESLFNPLVKDQLLSEGYTDEQLKAKAAAGQVFFIRGSYHPRVRRNHASRGRSGEGEAHLPELHASGMGFAGDESQEQAGWTIRLYKNATPNTVYHEFTHIMDKARGRVATEQRAKDYAERIERGEDVQFSLADEYAEILEMLERAKPLPSRAATAGYKFGEAAGKANLQERMAKLRERAKERQLKAVMGARIGERAKGRRQGFKEGFQVGAKQGEESGKILATSDAVKLGFQEIARESKSQYFKVLLSAGETMEMARANEAGKTPEEIEKLQDWVLGKMFGEERYRNIRRSAHRDRGTAIDIVRQVLQKELAGKYGDEVGRLIGKAPKLMEQYQTEWDSLTENVTPEDLKRKNWSFAKNLYEQLSEIYQSNQNERRMFMLQRRATAQEMASDAAGVIEQSYPVIKGSEMATPRRRGRGKYLFVDKAGNAETRALGMSAGDPNGIAAQVLHRNIVDSQTEAMTYEQDVARPVLEFMKQNGMDDATLVKMISEYRPIQLGDRSVMMSDMEKIDLAASWQDPETKMLIAMNGFNMERRKGQQDARIMGNSPSETEQMVESVIASMPTSHQRLATLMVDQATSMSEEMNKVSEVLDGWSRFTKPRYWMRRVDRSTTQQSIDVDSTARGVYQQTLKSLGFKKARQEHTHPAMIGDALAKFLNHVQMAARYAKMSLAEHDAINLIGNPDFAGAVNSRLGSGYLRDTREMIARAAGMKGFESDTPAGRFADYLSRNVAVSILWLRPTSIIYNRYGGSMLAYTELLSEDNKAAAWYLKNAFMPRFVKKAEKDAIIAKLLKNGYLGKRWRSDLAQTYSALPTERAGDMAKTSFRLKWRKMQTFGLQPMARAEMRNAIFAYMAKKHAGATDAEAVKTAERITRSTQNPSSDVEAPGLYVELKNNHMGWIAPFLGQPAVSRNIVVRDSLLLKHALTTGNQTKIHAARVKLAASILGLAGNIALRVLVLSMMGKLYGYNDDDEKKDESWLRVVEIAVSDVLDLVLPGAGRLADGIFSVIQRKRPRDMSLFGGVQRGLVRGLTRGLHPFDAEGAFDAGKLWDGIYNLTEATLSAAGGPVGGPVVVGRIIKAQLFKEEEPMPTPSGARSRDSTRDRMDRLYQRREGR